MVKVDIYSSANCPYCVQAKKLLKHKGISYNEIRVDQDPEQLIEMINKAQGRRTVPQIFINDKPIGGFDELRKLDHQGELDNLIKEK